MWVLQYLQYPNPGRPEAGRRSTSTCAPCTTACREPPPKGPRGADRITILEDPDEHGRFRKAKDFVTGLNLATGMCLGHGGVFVVQPPYLLFYPDKQRRRRARRRSRGAAQGLRHGGLARFRQFAAVGPRRLAVRRPGQHGRRPRSAASSSSRASGAITADQGSSSCSAEGGGNTWGLDFDRHGNVIAGTNFGGNAMLHQVQGAYYIKGFGKHGPLHNPYTFGYFEHVPYTGFKGGHVTCGGIVYQGDALPGKYREPVHRRQPALERHLLAHARAAGLQLHRPASAATC